MNQSDHPDSTLPAPPADGQAHSTALVERIVAAIDAAGGALDFDEFMQMALYEPGFGYYAAGATKFGEAGDFVTAPELGTLFGKSLAVQVGEVLGLVDGGDVLEFGAGTGALAAVLLPALEALGTVPARYLILETSPDLRERQRERLRESLSAPLLARVVWLDELPSALTGVVVANEVLDAMPVRRFRIVADGFEWLEVTADADGLALTWRQARADDQSAVAGLELPELPENYTSEIGAAGQAWTDSIGKMLTSGAVLLIDYGYSADEYYLPDRSNGTLRCHYRHRAHDDVLFYPGLQDITAHVDFTGVAQRAVNAGLSVSGFTSQASFLLALGLLNIAESSFANSIAKDVPVSQEIMTLTGPSAMGESFKVMALTRGINTRLSGFALGDRTGRL